MKIKAQAKVNLALDVVGIMENEYHELDMIMAPVSLYNENRNPSIPTRFDYMRYHEPSKKFNHL